MSRSKKPKMFVLDTNVILHKGDCLYDFDDNDVVVPVCVLEELDTFKSGTDSKNYNARQFTRIIDELSGDDVFNGGVEIAPDKGKLTVLLEKEYEEEIKINFPERRSDHSILNSALILKKENPGRKVIIVSKDVNLRMKAKAIGLLAQDLTVDKAPDVLYKGVSLEEGVPSRAIDLLYKKPNRFDINVWGKPDVWLNNQYLILKNGDKSGLGRFSSSSRLVKRVDPGVCYKIRPRNAEQNFALDALINGNIKLVSLTGKAGTGKTLLALASSLHVRSQYLQIFMTRPTVPLSNKDNGFLPGDISLKLDPYMKPLFDNLAFIKHKSKEEKENKATEKGTHLIDKLLEDEKILIQPLSYIRGRSLPKVFFIIDEAQNLTPHEVKTIITRAGEGTKIVFTGDIHQIDHPYLTSTTNGLSYLVDRMKGQEIYAHVHLEKGERSKLASLASEIL